MSKDDFVYYGPYEPFPQPVPLPSSLPTDFPHRSLCINRDWVPYIIGALKVLLQPETWDAPAATLEPVRGMLYNLLADWQEPCVSDIQFRNPDSCTLQVSFDRGATWLTILTAQQCINDNIANGTLQGGKLGTMPPAFLGTCIDYFPTVPGNGSWSLPVVVNAGDTIQVTQHPTGQVWTDSIAGMVLYCPDGTFFLPLVGCGAGDPAHAGDPDMTAFHMELLGQVGTTIFHPLAGLFVVPIGVVNQTVVFYPNDGVLWDNVGNIQFKVEHCSVGWTHTFDFTLADGGWTNYVAGHGHWVSGQGWVDDYFPIPQGAYIEIKRLLSHSVNIVRWTAYFDITNLYNPTGSGIWATSDLGAHDIIPCCPVPGGMGVVQDSGFINTLAATEVEFRAQINQPTLPWQMTLRKIVISGSGTDPF